MTSGVLQITRGLGNRRPNFVYSCHRDGCVVVVSDGFLLGGRVTISSFLILLFCRICVKKHRSLDDARQGPISLPEHARSRVSVRIFYSKSLTRVYDRTSDFLPWMIFCMLVSFHLFHCSWSTSFRISFVLYHLLSLIVPHSPCHPYISSFLFSSCSRHVHSTAPP